MKITRTIASAGLLLLCSVFGFALKETELNTKIEEVKVFQNGAQVTRRGSMLLPAGTTEIAVKNISPLMKKESIRLKAEGDLIVLSVNHQVKYDEHKALPAEIDALEKKQRELEMKIEDLDTRLSVLKTEEDMITSLKNAGSDNPQIVEIMLKARNAAHTTLTEIKNEQLNVTRQLKTLRESHTLVSQELSARRAPRTSVNYEVVIKVKAAKETKGEFTLSYVVTNARWYPYYDVRVKNVNEPLTIEYKANVSQQTGEDWSNVKLVLSTSDPSLNGQRPKLEKWTLQPNSSYQHQNSSSAYNSYQRNTGGVYGTVKGQVTDQYGEPLPFANVMVPGTTVGTTTDFDGYFSLVMPPGSSQLSVTYIGYKPVNMQVNASQMQNIHLVMEENTVSLEEVSIISERKVKNISEADIAQNISVLPGVVNTKQKKNKNKIYTPSVSTAVTLLPQLNIVDVEFEIKEKYDIPSDVKVYTIGIQELQAPAYYEYYCAPKLDKDVFLTAKLTDWEQYNLLEGQTSIYYEGTFVGNGVMNTRFVSDTLDISLGRDRNVVVERNKLKDYNKRQLLGGDAYAYRQWDISVKNNKQSDINLVMEDQYPVSGDSRIEVKREEHDGAEVDDASGIVKWNLKLEKGGSKKVKLKYSVKHPKNMTVGLD